MGRSRLFPRLESHSHRRTSPPPRPDNPRSRNSSQRTASRLTAFPRPLRSIPPRTGSSRPSGSRSSFPDQLEPVPFTGPSQPGCPGFRLCFGLILEFDFPREETPPKARKPAPLFLGGPRLETNQNIAWGSDSGEIPSRSDISGNRRIQNTEVLLHFDFVRRVPGSRSEARHSHSRQDPYDGNQNHHLNKRKPRGFPGPRRFLMEPRIHS